MYVGASGRAYLADVGNRLSFEASGNLLDAGLRHGSGLHGSHGSGLLQGEPVNRKNVSTLMVDVRFCGGSQG